MKACMNRAEFRKRQLWELRLCHYGYIFSGIGLTLCWPNCSSTLPHLSIPVFLLWVERCLKELRHHFLQDSCLAIKMDTFLDSSLKLLGFILIGQHRSRDHLRTFTLVRSMKCFDCSHLGHAFTHMTQKAGMFNLICCSRLISLS